MLAGLALALALAPIAAADTAKVAVQHPVPPGPYVVEYNCFHSDMPWGKGSQFDNRSYDLAAKKATAVAGRDDGVPKPEPAPAPKPVVTKLSDERVQKLAAAVAKVLAGGPYAPELPVPEGSPCRLTIYGDKHAVAFAIDKAYTRQADDVTALVKQL